jgi:transposase
METRLLEAVRKTDGLPLLNSIPGIGKVLATIILLEIGSISRFLDVGDFASYARCVHSKRISNGEKKGQGDTKNGNKYLSWAFVEAADFAARFCPEDTRFHAKKFAKTNGAVAIKALVHQLAKACYHML